MLKKMLAVAAILLVAGTVFGGQWDSKFGTFDPNNISNDRTVDYEKWSDNSNLTQRKGEVWNWPATYDYLEIGKIKVQMEVGFWIRLDCRDHDVLTLKQRQINQYGGQTTCKAYTNVATEWKVSFSLKDGVDIGGGWDKSVAIDPSSFPATKGAAQSLTIKMKIWGLELGKLTPTNQCTDVGTITISVRPSVKPNTFMSGQSGSYPVYSPPPFNADATWW